MLKIAGVFVYVGGNPGEVVTAHAGSRDPVVKAKIRKPTPNKLCLLKQIVNVNKDISFHNKENKTSYMLLFILFISVLGARRNCDATGKTPNVDIFFTVWLGCFGTLALK